MKLREAITLPTQRQRRAALRKLADANLRKHEGSLVRSLNDSPLVGDGANQMAMPHKSVAALRDLLDVDTLMAVAKYDGWAEAVGLALVHPATYGVSAPANKCGVVFGRPKSLTPVMAEDIRREILNEPPFGVGDAVAISPWLKDAPSSWTQFRWDQLRGRVGAVVGFDTGTTPSALVDWGGEQRWHDPLDLVHTQEGLDSMSLEKILGAYDLLVFDGCGDPIPAIAEVLAARGHDEAWRDATRASLARLVAERPDKPASREDVTSWDAELYEKAKALLAAPAPAATGLTPPDARASAMIDALLGTVGLPSIESLLRTVNENVDERAKLAAEVEDLRKRSAIAPLAAPVAVAASGDLPEGRVVQVKAHEAFGIARGKEAFDFHLPSWEWDGPHPYVPEVDPDYIFRPFELLRMLWAVLSNERAWLYGHTGSGKSTLVEQVAARLNWPFMRVNFDSDITRMDLVGRETLRSEGGVTVSEFVDGILPQALAGPHFLCLDEVDYSRPDVAFVLQRMNEGKGLMLTEDGGRLVPQHPYCRIFATGNTQGAGDEFGMYSGARQQSAAFCDRFTVWIKVDYLTSSERAKLIKAKVPSLPADEVDRVNQYVGEHLEAFTTAKVMQPISPRGMLAVARALAAFLVMLPNKVKARDEAIASAVLDRASPQDRVVLSGIVDRVWK